MATLSSKKIVAAIAGIFVLVGSVFCLSVFIGKGGLSEKLTDGFWLANTTGDSKYDIDLEYGEDYGFIFKKSKNGNFDGIAINCAQQTWKYSLDKNNSVEIFRYYSNDERYKLMFTGMYDKKADALTLSFTEEAEDYFDTMNAGSVVTLKHFPDKQSNNSLYKKLIFDTWATVDVRNKKSLTAGFADKKTYNNFRNEIYKSSDQNVNLYKFYYNYKDFDLSEGNSKRLYYNAQNDNWSYQGETYFFENSGGNFIIIGSSVYSYDKNMTQLVNTEDSSVIYRVTRFADGDVKEDNQPNSFI